MHPNLIEQIAQQRTDAFHREIEADRRAALAKETPDSPLAIEHRQLTVAQRLTQAVGRLFLRVRGSAA